jgi:hypothetical protein
VPDFLKGGSIVETAANRSKQEAVIAAAECRQLKGQRVLGPRRWLRGMELGGSLPACARETTAHRSRSGAVGVRWTVSGLPSRDIAATWEWIEDQSMSPRARARLTASARL